MTTPQSLHSRLEELDSLVKEKLSIVKNYYQITDSELRHDTESITYMHAAVLRFVKVYYTNDSDSPKSVQIQFAQITERLTSSGGVGEHFAMDSFEMALLHFQISTAMKILVYILYGRLINDPSVY